MKYMLTYFDLNAIRQKSPRPPIQQTDSVNSD